MAVVGRAMLPKVWVYLVFPFLFCMTVVDLRFWLPDLSGLADVKSHHNPYYLLDESWQRSLPIFAQRRLLAGTDYVFTYGPLGWLMVRFFDHSTYWAVVAWDLCSKLFVGHLVARLCFYSCVNVCKGDVVNRIGWLSTLGVFIWFNLIPLDKDSWTYIANSIILLSMALDRPISWQRLTAMLAFAAVGPLVKLTLLPVSLLLLAVAMLAGKDEVRVPGRIPIWVLPSLFFAILTLLWVVTGQKIANILAYSRGALEIALGYSDAMAFLDLGSKIVAVSMLMSGLLLCCGLVVRCVGVERARVYQEIACLGIVPIVVIAYKHSVIRVDHIMIYFSTVIALCSILLVVGFGSKSESVMRRIMFWCFGLSMGLAIIGVVKLGYRLPTSVSGVRFVDEIGQLSSLTDQWELLARKSAEADKTQALPHVIQVVGRMPVDQFANHQLAVISQGLNYKPRPCFQGYSAYTAYLQNQNATFYESDEAPDFVLYRPAPIDFRYPMLEDARAHFVLLSQYQPMFQEGGYLLLRHQAQRDKASSFKRVVEEAKSAQDRTAEVGRWVSVNLEDAEHLLWLSIDVKESFAGKLRAALYKQASIGIEVRLEDGAERRYRLVPRMARDGFILSPMILRTEHMESYMRGQPGAPVVTAWRVVVPGPDAARLYHPTYSFRLVTLPNPVSKDVTEK